VLALWKGNVPALAMVAAYGGVQFAVYGTLMRLSTPQARNVGEPVPTQAGEKVHKVLRYLLCGCGAGLTATIVTYPLDFLRTRLAVDLRRSWPLPWPQNSALGSMQARRLRDVARTVYAKEGLSGLYEGSWGALAVIAPTAAVQFALFETLSAWPLLDQLPSVALKSLVAGAIAGTGSKVLLMPFDNVKKALQVQTMFANDGERKYKGAWHCFHKLRRQGVLKYTIIICI
jgi:hypothetical protein